MPAIIAAQASNPLAADISAKLVDRPVADGTDTAAEERKWKVVAGALTNEGRIYIPAFDHLHGKVINLHFGALKTTGLVSRDFYWSAIDSHVRKYVSGCEVCH